MDIIAPGSLSGFPSWAKTAPEPRNRVVKATKAALNREPEVH